MHSSTAKLISLTAPLLYHPLSKVYAPCLQNSLQTALSIVDVLSSGNVYSSKMLSEIASLEFRYTKHCLNALKAGGLPFLQSGTGKGGRSEQYWQLPKHPAALHASSTLKLLKVPDFYKPPNSNLNTNDIIKQNALILYHPLSRVWIPALRDGVITALDILEVLSDGQPHSLKSIQTSLQDIGKPFTYDHLHIVIAALQHGGLDFGTLTHMSNRLWQLPPHPAQEQLPRLKQILYILDPIALAKLTPLPPKDKSQRNTTNNNKNKKKKKSSTSVALDQPAGDVTGDGDGDGDD